MAVVDIGKDFHHRLANRNKKQGDGKFTAEDFRKKYLGELDSPNAWLTDDEFISLDFSNVKKFGPSFANEAFAYFTRYEKTVEKIKKKIRFLNLSKVQEMILDVELRSGWGER